MAKRIVNMVNNLIHSCVLLLVTLSFGAMATYDDACMQITNKELQKIRSEVKPRDSVLKCEENGKLLYKVRSLTSEISNNICYFEEKKIDAHSEKVMVLSVNHMYGLKRERHCVSLDYSKFIDLSNVYDDQFKLDLLLLADELENSDKFSNVSRVDVGFFSYFFSGDFKLFLESYNNSLEKIVVFVSKETFKGNEDVLFIGLKLDGNLWSLKLEVDEEFKFEAVSLVSQ